MDDTTDQFVAGSGTDLVLITWYDEEDDTNTSVKVLCSVDTNLHNQTRINDGKVDSEGRFWLGELRLL